MLIIQPICWCWHHSVSLVLTRRDALSTGLHLYALGRALPVWQAGKAACKNDSNINHCVGGIPMRSGQDLQNDETLHSFYRIYYLTCIAILGLDKDLTWVYLLYTNYTSPIYHLYPFTSFDFP